VTVPVNVRAAAQRDIDEAARWYESQHPGLGDANDAAVVLAVMHGNRDPQRWKQRS
jgi:plasmid stabilization system protein ParE